MNGEKIKEARKRLKLSQEELANKIGVSKVSICWYESGERTPNLENFVSLIDILKLTPDEALGREVSVVSDNNTNYTVKLAKKDLEIISEIKKRPKLYKKLYNEPERTVELIERRLK